MTVKIICQYRNNKIMKTEGLLRPYLIFALLVFSILFLSCSKEEIEDSDQMQEEDICPGGNLYVEKDGLVRVDIVNLSSENNGWNTSKELSGFVGSDYLIWTGSDNFNSPGIGKMNFSIQISNPGTYQFVWNSRIGTGTNNTEHNDSWLRIEGKDFYGEKASTGDRVYPKGSGKTPNPEGSSKDGWLKIYMNKVGEWFWRSSTNDKDPFNVFVEFEKAGTFDIEISGRSKSHAIDQFVLFKSGNTLSQAKAAPFSVITCK